METPPGAEEVSQMPWAQADHIVATCRKDHDIWGTCTGCHWTSECTEQEVRHFKCVNYNVGDHVSWSRDCSYFIHHNKKFQAKFPEHKFKYFLLGSDPSTWEKLGSTTEQGTEVGPQESFGSTNENILNNTGAMTQVARQVRQQYEYQASAIRDSPLYFPLSDDWKIFHKNVTVEDLATKYKQK
jgi:hypothetical protein